MKKILMIVDDDKTSLERARMILQEQYEAVVANSGTIALKLLERQMPDLMLLDINMPQMDGFEVMERMRTHPLWRDIPIIVLTADTNSAHEVEALRRGAVDVIKKPFAVDVMLSRIERTIKINENRKELERQWQNIHNMVSVEQILFDAHRTEDGIGRAVSLLCEAESASRAYLMEYHKENVICVNEWCSKNQTSHFEHNQCISSETFSEWEEQLKNHYPISIPDVEKIRQIQPFAYQFLKTHGINSFVAAPIYFSDNTFHGFLGIDDPGSNLHSMDMLCFMSLGFSIAFENREEHKRIERLGLTDLTTDVLNRNSYFNYLHHYHWEKGQSLGCVFIDVNGLHEYNNEYGHEQGDQMLCFIAQVLKEQFGKNEVYRVGGDEFVVLVENITEDKLVSQIEEADQRITDKGFCVSIGCQWSQNEVNAEELIRRADEQMYYNKERYYQEHDRRRSRR